MSRMQKNVISLACKLLFCKTHLFSRQKPSNCRQYRLFWFWQKNTIIRRREERHSGCCATCNQQWRCFQHVGRRSRVDQSKFGWTRRIRASIWTEKEEKVVMRINCLQLSANSLCDCVVDMQSSEATPMYTTKHRQQYIQSNASMFEPTKLQNKLSTIFR